MDGAGKDLPPGEQLLSLFRPFLQHLAASDLSPKTIQKHVDNMWALGWRVHPRSPQRSFSEKEASGPSPLPDNRYSGPLLYHGGKISRDRSIPRVGSSAGSSPRRLANARKYKPSRFNAHTLDDDGALVLFNSYTGHNCVIPAPTAAQAIEYLSAKGFTAVPDRLVNYLLSKGYIVEEQVDEDGRWDVRYGIQQYRQNHMELILLSSEDCNFRCVYCSQEFKRGSMQPEVRTGVRNLVLARIRHLRSLSIDWFGGEPLVGYDAIENLAPFIQEQAAKYDVRFTAGMTTNAYLLFPERSRQLVQWGVTAYQITLDGGAIEHDAHRPLATGGGTFDQILANLTAMKRIAEPFKVAIRFDFDRANLPHAETLFQNVKAALGDDPRFSMRFRPVGQWGGPNDEDLEVCGVKEATRQLIQLTVKAEGMGLPTEKLSDELLPGIPNVCYAARPYNLIVGADGKLMKCTVVLDTMEDNVVGRLHEDGSIAVNEDRFAKWVKPYYREDPMCSKCFYVPVCQGVICPLPRLTTGERPCPPPKLEIQKTLKEVRAAQTRRAAARVVPLTGMGRVTAVVAAD